MKYGALLLAVAAVSVLGFAMGLTYPLLSLQLDQRNYSAALIGINAASQPLGTVAAVFVISPLVGRFGVKSVALACAIVTAAVLCAYPAIPNFFVWCGLRFVQGLAFSILFAISEAWVIEFAAGAHRARLLSLYMSAFAASLALGPVVVAATGAAGPAAFLIGAAVVLLVTVPVAMIPAIESPASPARLPVSEILRRNGVAVLAVVVFAVTEITSLGLLPVYGRDHDLSVARAALLASAFVSGPILLQYPLGWLADRYPKKHNLLASAAVSYLIYLLLPPLIGSPAIYVLLCVLGATTANLYTLALALLGEKYSGDRLVSATAVVSAVYGLGSLAGSGAGGLAMAAAGSAILPYLMAAALVGLFSSAAVARF